VIFPHGLRAAALDPCLLVLVAALNGVFPPQKRRIFRFQAHLCFGTTARPLELFFFSPSPALVTVRHSFFFIEAIISLSGFRLVPSLYFFLHARVGFLLPPLVCCVARVFAFLHTGRRPHRLHLRKTSVQGRLTIAAYKVLPLLFRVLL